MRGIQVKRFLSLMNDIISFQLPRPSQFLKNNYDKYVICRSRQETVTVMVNIFILLTKPKKYIVVCFMVCQHNISIRSSNY